MKKLTYIVLVISVFASTSCEKAIFEPDPENNPEALFVNLWTSFNTDYAGFEERGVDWASASFLDKRQHAGYE